MTEEVNSLLNLRKFIIISAATRSLPCETGRLKMDSFDDWTKFTFQDFSFALVELGKT